MYKYKYIGKFEDGTEISISGNIESACIEAIGNIQNCGKLELYYGATDDEYLDGELREEHE